MYGPLLLHLMLKRYRLIDIFFPKSTLYRNFYLRTGFSSGLFLALRVFWTKHAFSSSGFSPDIHSIKILLTMTKNSAYLRDYTN